MVELHFPKPEVWTHLPIIRGVIELKFIYGVSRAFFFLLAFSMTRHVQAMLVCAVGYVGGWVDGGP